MATRRRRRSRCWCRSTGSPRWSSSWPTEEEEEEADGNGDVSDGEERVKPPKKRRFEPCGDRSRHREVEETPPQLVGGRSDAASAPRTKRLLVPGRILTEFMLQLDKSIVISWVN
uniref:Uncharacterized protein n=1 Tax=Oryza meridionalis TaxID=40149 RepID=A0A0E0DGL3_9ORYZ